MKSTIDKRPMEPQEQIDQTHQLEKLKSFREQIPHSTNNPLIFKNNEVIDLWQDSLKIVDLVTPRTNFSNSSIDFMDIIDLTDHETPIDEVVDQNDIQASNDLSKMIMSASFLTCLDNSNTIEQINKDHQTMDSNDCNDESESQYTSYSESVRRLLLNAPLQVINRKNLSIPIHSDETIENSIPSSVSNSAVNRETEKQKRWSLNIPVNRISPQSTLTSAHNIKITDFDDMIEIPIPVDNVNSNCASHSKSTQMKNTINGKISAVTRKKKQSLSAFRNFPLRGEKNTTKETSFINKVQKSRITTVTRVNAVPPYDKFALKKVNANMKLESDMSTCTRNISSLTKEFKELIVLKKEDIKRKREVDEKNENIFQTTDGYLNLILEQWITLSLQQQAELFHEILNLFARFY